MKITGLSKHYLKKFLSFAEKQLDYGPIIVGGWAVYAITKTEQSVDVDALLKSGNDVNKLKEFFKENGFEKHEDSKGNVSFELTLEKPGDIQGVKIENLIFDLMTVDEKNALHENPNIEIPWKLAYEYSTKTSLEGITLKIPSIELLLIFKVKALKDRIHDKYKFRKFMKNRKIWLSRKDFKIEKDKRDIKNLIQTNKVNPDKLNEILKKTGFKKDFEEAIQGLIS